MKNTKSNFILKALLASLCLTVLALWILFSYAMVTDGPVYGIWMVDHRLAWGETHDLYGCRNQLFKLSLFLEIYAQDYQGRLPPAKGPDDYYYWLSAYRAYPYDAQYMQGYGGLYCPLDKERKYPSSYISDPRLAGKKLAELQKIPDLVLLRERDFPHSEGKGAVVYSRGSDTIGWEELSRIAKFNPPITPKIAKYQFEWYLPPDPLLGFLAVLVLLFLDWFLFSLWRQNLRKEKKP